jgi:hypothetical protein
VIEAVDRPVQVGFCDLAEIGSLGEVESQQAIGVFVRSPLPGRIGVGKEKQPPPAYGVPLHRRGIKLSGASLQRRGMHPKKTTHKIPLRWRGGRRSLMGWCDASNQKLYVAPL